MTFLMCLRAVSIPQLVQSASTQTLADEGLRAVSIPQLVQSPPGCPRRWRSLRAVSIPQLVQSLVTPANLGGMSSRGLNSPVGTMWSRR